MCWEFAMLNVRADDISVMFRRIWYTGSDSERDIYRRVPDQVIKSGHALLL